MEISQCNGEPPCPSCVRRKTECVFTQRETGIVEKQRADLDRLRKENNDLRMQLASGNLKTVDGLESSSNEQALVPFHQIEAAKPSEAAMAPLQMVITTEDIDVPSSQSLEFELMARYSFGYLTPLIYNKMSVTTFRPASDSPMYTPSRDSRTGSILSNDQSSISPTERHGPHTALSPNDSIGDLYTVCDERLRHFEVHQWLQTEVSTVLASRAISHYLVTDHPTLGLFDADLFLGDLVSRKTEFCSPLLLSALLSLACQGYTAFEPQAAGLSHEFFAEAEQLYNEEKTVAPQYGTAIMTVAALQLMSVAATCHGRQAIAHQYLHYGIQLAGDNGLLAVNEGQSARSWLDDHVLCVRAASHTAWGTFCMATLRGMNYHRSYIDIQPWLPIPGTVIERTNAESIAFHLPDYMGQSFTQLCRLTPIIREILGQYYDSGDRIAPTLRSSPEFAEKIYSRLLAWSDTLPLSMSRAQNMPHHAAVLHICLHTAIADLFRPLLYRTIPRPLNVGRCTADKRTSEDVYMASINQLKHLVLIFRTQYDCSPRSHTWQNALLYVANACVPLHSSLSHTAQLQDPSVDVEASRKIEGIARRKWFLACVDGYKNLASNFVFVQEILTGLLSMAVMRGIVTTSEVDTILEVVRVDAPHFPQVHLQQQRPHAGQASSAGGVESPLFERFGEGNSFIVDLNLAVMHPDGASVTATTQSLSNMNLSMTHGSVEQ
ncbi:hypothetical protein M406DRAFT_73893 [Cryphonectria parasitica EP155]|uniref:Transcription factor domain-containing protein n=1 Tax=Cryphonectria parasitica (strain ATCC 38755 / EP155) TaxID=660469 RepID=A0A9P5CNE2_CRYP1|nr:uncharacterized protein M406DRAFT_73893 [Cryphonectria parasitica EP155]KAF3764046.1 hypothetical protein M406DRAFT_73893 [Cryphonectria parasitica EP155]